MKIEVWSDFVCPFCYIGKRRLENALAQFPNKDSVTVEYKSFELDPNAPANSGKSIHEMLAAKYGMSVEEAKRANEGVKQQAASAGLVFNFEEMKPTNTFDAHRLAKFAKEKGKEAEITEQLLRAYFTESKQIGSHETLAEIAVEIGLDRTEAAAVLADEKTYAVDVRNDEAIAQQYKITGVPFFILNEKYAISGAQPEDVFANALQQVWEEEKNSKKLQFLDGDEKTEFCEGDDCC